MPRGQPVKLLGMSEQAGGLLERDGEHAALAALVAQAAAGGDGAVVFVEGQAGLGKTELVGTACQLAQAAGMQVLRARGSELDRTFAFGLVRQLLAREAARDPELLTHGAELAEPVLAPSGSQPAGELLASLEGLQWLVANLAARGPLLIAADDLHWSDRASLRWLVFMAERIDELPVLLVAAARPAEPEADLELLDALATATATHLVRPAPLSVDAASTLVRRRLPDAAGVFCAACHRATGGNPFLLGELLEELADEDRTGSAEEAGEVLEFGSERVSRAVLRRLRLQPPQALALARAVAVLEPSRPLAEAAELAGLREDEAARLADALVAVHLFAEDSSLDFAHPVVRAAVYDAVRPHERQALHARAAALLQARGAAAEQVARHLLRISANHDPAIVEVLRAAAREAWERGASEAALTYLRRALEEQPEAEQRSAVLHELGVTEAAHSEVEQFPDHFREALEAATDPAARMQIALDFGRALGANGRIPECLAAFEEGLQGLTDFDDPIAVKLEAELVAMSHLVFGGTEMARTRWTRRAAQLAVGEDLDPATLASLVFPVGAHGGSAEQVVELVDRILARTRLDDLNSVLGGALGNALVYTGELSRAAAFYDEAIAAARASGALSGVAWRSAMRSSASLRLGELRRAEMEARLARDVFTDQQGEGGWLWVMAVFAEALVARGAIDEADAVVTGTPFGSGAGTYPHAYALVARAEVHLSLGRSRLALQDALEAGRLASPTISNPAHVSWRAPAALALSSLGRGEEARAMAEAELGEARAFGFPLAVGSALRSLGMAVGGAEGIALLRESAEILERSEGRYSHGRSVLELGAALRRAGERTEAREVLRDALDMAAHMGASGLADRAHEELVAAGARPRRDRQMLSGRESLTASEDRVATLAAEGLTNREIAQRLFVTVKAVQWHLRNVYRKLDIGSREELPGALELGAAETAL